MDRKNRLNQAIIEIKNEMNQVEITIQKLKKIQDENISNSPIREEIQKSIINLDTQKEFLGQMKNDDECYLRSII